MGAQSVVEIYRTAEHGGTYKTAMTITYFDDSATIQGISGTFTNDCWRELMAYLIIKGIKYYQYERRKNGKNVFVKRLVRGG